MVGNLIIFREWVVLQGLLVLPDHAEELPVGVARVNVLFDLLLLKYFCLLCPPFFSILLHSLDLLHHVGPTTI